MRTVVALLAFGGVSLAPAAGRAEAPGGQIRYDSTSVNYQPPKTERRGGFAMGITGTYGIGTYDGYPLSVDALNDPNGEQSTGPSFASNFNWWFGGAPRDWLSTGLGFSALSAQFNRATGVGIGLLLHVEAFPFYSLGGLYRDLGIGLDGGLGVVTMFDADDKEFEEPIAESGSLSTIAVSAFWEPIRLWNVSMGPAANYVHGFSQTMHINQFTVGWRTSLYGVQPKKKKRAGS